MRCVVGLPSELCRDGLRLAVILVAADTSREDNEGCLELLRLDLLREWLPILGRQSKERGVLGVLEDVVGCEPRRAKRAAGPSWHISCTINKYYIYIYMSQFILYVSIYA
jgi:hypothetical protein